MEDAECGYRNAYGVWATFFGPGTWNSRVHPGNIGQSLTSCFTLDLVSFKTISYGSWNGFACDKWLMTGPLLFDMRGIIHAGKRREGSHDEETILQATQ